jgi:hypothetical protein
VADPRRNFTLGFVLYDSKRDIYITADFTVHNDIEVLWVQERATGRRLQPAKSPLTDSDISCQTLETPSTSIHKRRPGLVNAVLSRDRTYLAILYEDFDSEGYFITSIWIIQDSLDFHNIRYRRPWARRLHCFGTHSPSFAASCLPLTVGQDGLFYCPTGQIHPERGIQKRIPRNFAYPQDKSAILAFSGNGQILIKLDRSNGFVEELSWLEDTVTESWQLRVPASHGQQERGYLRAISQTARFMIYETLRVKDERYETPFKDYTHDTPFRVDQSSVVFYLLDC